MGSVRRYLVSLGGVVLVVVCAGCGGGGDGAGAEFDAGLVFASDRDGNDEIYVMGADGSNQIRRTHDVAPDIQPVSSPDGYGAHLN